MALMTRGIGGKFGLRGPCLDCPFRRDKTFPPNPARVAEIAASQHADEGFSCRRTNAFAEDGNAVLSDSSRE
jgi:hypothetical protein